MKRQKPVVQLQNVGKRFPLYASPLRQMLGYLGFGSRGIPHKQAIDGVNLTIAHGEKVGVVGHNGSGKTTLLRLITGFTRPTSGEVKVGGMIQALMQSGYGFNDALSGLDNIRNALVYNGLSPSLQIEAELDIVDFVELGEFLHHPVKTYSLGMRARLEFAAATAIHPDVLVIDEVLGAGDGYFVNKSARRMRRLVANTTLILVSHSLDQIREYCDRVIWMDGGRLREDGPVDLVLGNYRRYMNERSSQLLRGASSSKTRTMGTVGPQIKTSLTAKLREMFGSGEEGGHIHEFTVELDCGRLLMLETGDSLALYMDFTLQKSMQPVVLGLTEHGGFVFEMSLGEALPVGRHKLVLRSPRLEVGVGSYILVPALAVEGHEGYAVLGEMQINLQMAATNWSDPPLVHFDGQWFSGPGHKLISSKVSAWV